MKTLENAKRISTARFNRASDARRYHLIMEVAGYLVGPVESFHPGEAKRPTSWAFTHRSDDGGAVAVISHLLGHHGPVDKDWLARQWPDEYKRVAGAMLPNYKGATA